MDSLLSAIVLEDHLGVEGFRLGAKVLFFSPELCLGFYPYDDRGADLFSREPGSLLPIYERFEEWILDCDRKRIMCELGMG